jgi:hypothetical protein
LGDAMVVQRWNDQEVTSHIHAKTQCKWGRLVIIAKQCPPLPKRTLVKLASKQLLQVLSLNVSGVGSMPRNATSKWRKTKIYKRWSIHFAYAWQLKMTWDVKNWDQKSTKAN